MKYLKKFESFPGEAVISTIDSNGIIKPNHNVKSDVINTIYDKRWESQLPPFITINYHGKLYKFKRDNIMLHSDMIQITYASTPMNGQESEEIWGSPDTLEFDIYFAKEDNIILNIDITYGDAMACEFSVEAPNKIKVIEYTSYHSKFDTSNTVFGFDNDSLESFVKFLNNFSGMKLKKEDFKFLDQNDDYLPN
jgi:hypothetical protein